MAFENNEEQRNLDELVYGNMPIGDMQNTTNSLLTNNILPDEKITMNNLLYGDVSAEDAATIKADNSLTEAQKTSALMDPESYKVDKQNINTDLIRERFPGVFRTLESPTSYALAKSYYSDLIRFEEEIEKQQMTDSNFKAFWKEIGYARKSMQLDDLYAQYRDAEHDGDTRKMEELQQKINDKIVDLEFTPKGRSMSGTPEVVGSVVASGIRELPEMIAWGAASYALAAIPGGQGAAVATAAKATTSISRFKKAFDVYRGTKTARYISRMAPTIGKLGAGISMYNDTANVEGGAAYKELKEKHPDWTEEQIYDSSVMVGRIIGALEVPTMFLGLGAAPYKATTATLGIRSLKKAVPAMVEKYAEETGIKDVVVKEATKKALVEGIEKGTIKKEYLKSIPFVQKLSDKINKFWESESGKKLSKLLESKTAGVAKFGAEAGYEGLTEDLQNQISEAAMESDQPMGYGEAISKGLSSEADVLKGIYNYYVNEKELDEKTAESLRTIVGTMIGSAFMGAPFKGIEAGAKYISKTQPKAPVEQYAQAQKTTQTFDTILEQKKAGGLYAKSPEASKEFYKNIVQSNELPENTYIEKDVIEKVLDKIKDDPIAMAKVNALKIPERIAAGEDLDVIEIPTEDFIDVAVDPKNDTFYQEIKGAITNDPSVNGIDGITEYVKRISEQDLQFKKQVDAENSIYNQVYKSNIEGGASEKLAKVNASIAQLTVNRIAEWRDVSVEKAMQDIKLRLENVERIEKGQKKQAEVTEETKRLAEEYAKSLGQNVSDFHTRFISAIENKDIQTLSGLLLSGRGMNQKSKAMFSKVTGVKLTDTIKYNEKALVEWAGIDYDQYLKDKQKDIADAKAKREKEEKDRKFNEYVKELQDHAVLYEGKRMSEKELIDQLFGEGRTLEKQKVGINTVYKLVGKDGYIEFKKKNAKEYIDSLFEGGEPTLLQEQENAGILGSIQFGEETIVRLAKISNPTTFAHEMFHLFGMTLLSDYNAGLIKNKHYNKNAETLADWAGFKKDENGKYILTGEEARKAHEKIADGGLTYLKTGEAPASYLKEIFDVIAEWFANVWNALRMADVKLNKKVIKVFDDIFVPYETQKQILMERKLGFIPRPETMSAEEYAQYQAEKRAATAGGATKEIKEAARLQKVMTTEAYTKEFNGAYEYFFDELGKTPRYQMIDYITKYKISKASVESKLANPKSIPQKYISRDGLDISQIVGEFPEVAKNVDDMAYTISTTPTREDMATILANQHMDKWLADKHPQIAAASSETASRNEKAMRLAVKEFMMLSGMEMKRFNQVYSDLVAAAENTFKNMKLKKASNYARWMSQEAKLMQKYEILKSDKEKAEVKRQQAILNYFTMRGLQVGVEKKRFDKHMKKYKGTQTDAILRHIDGESFELVKHLLRHFGETKAQNNRDIPIGQRITDWVAGKIELFSSADDIKKYETELLNGVEREDGAMTVDEFGVLNDATSFVEAVGQRQKEIIVQGQIKQVEDAVKDIAQEYNLHNTKPIDKPLGDAIAVATVFKEVLPTRVWLDFFAPFFDGLALREKKISEWKAHVQKIIEPLAGEMQKKVTIGRHVYTIENLLVMMLNSGNEHNLRCMIRTLQTEFGDSRYDLDTYFTALNRAPKELREMTKQIWQIFKDNEKDFQEAQYQINGKVLRLVKPDGYKFEDGYEMPGGYYPAGKVNVAKNFDDDSLKFTTDVYPSTYSKERMAGEHGDLDLTLGTLNCWFYKMAGTLYLANSYNNLTKLLNESEFRRVVGGGMVDAIQDWRRLALTPDKVNQTLSTCSQVASVMFLGGNPFKFFTQLSGVIPAMVEVGPEVAVELANINPIRAISQASKLSPYMEMRYTHPEEHLHLYVTADSAFSKKARTIGKTTWSKTANALMMPVIYGDAIASMATWKAEYNKKIRAGYTDIEARQLADSAVMRLQGDASAGSRAKIIQGNMRFFTMFASYFIGVHSLVRAKLMKGDEAMQAVGLIMTAGIFAPMMESAFRTVQEMILSGDDDRKKWKKKGIENAFDLYLANSYKNVLSTAGAMWMPSFGVGSAIVQGIGTTIGAMVVPSLGKDRAMYQPTNIQLQIMELPINISIDLMHAAESYYDGDTEKSNKFFKKALKKVLSVGIIYDVIDIMTE